MVDDHSRYTWVHLLLLKSEAIVVIKTFISMIRTQFEIVVKTIRSDNRTEFINSQCKTLFPSLGILHQTSCPHTPQQNKVVERKHIHILNIARALKFQSHLPIKYWGLCVKATVYLINRLPSSVLSGMSLFQLMFSKDPKLSHLRVFGCLCYVTILPRDDKFTERAKPAVLMGYFESQKGYLMLDFTSKGLLVSRDIVFYENAFPSSEEDIINFLIPTDNEIFPEPATDSITEEVSIEEESISNATVPGAASPGTTHEETCQDNCSITQPFSSRPRRISRLPVWMHDYGDTSRNQRCKHPLANSLSYKNLSTTYQCHLTKFSTLTEPQHYKQAIKDARWVEAMKLEIQALEANNI
ncbi:uncharacterized protein LOC107847814 isoform X1 [Capsicum annuum]|uniref:uncharacterized protein LOC107847814 isoform X1 n=1 Tax=Capsicum annuum TaxID=4072 RepID=UPI001FB0A502|nr:uncharacterized protein LOC107847814 isoform X1 [Capsicum annuum]XP_047255619.1 uncharacterized protein LOC107847814 isoform X1 [Capsicum annuum]XP_047255620.1 uncharacterized protein LOC107847814 isoform X1 [Capsicum annuum]